LHPGEGEEDPETHESQPKRFILVFSVPWKRSVDNGSSADILFFKTFEKMNLS
jgi:hypothetical protein